MGVVVAGVLVALIVGATFIQAGGGSAAAGRGVLPPGAAFGRAFIQGALFLGPVAYLYVGWRGGATVGMHALHCRLQSIEGGPPSPSQVVLRLCGLWFALVCVGLGLLWGLFRPDRRGWPDLYAGTVVVHVPPWPLPGPAWSVPATALPAAGWNAAPPPPPPPSPPVAFAWYPPPPPAPAAGGPTAVVADRVPWTWTDVVPVVVLVLPLSLAVQYLTVRGLRSVLGGIALDTRRPIEALSADIAGYGSLFLLVLLFVRVRRQASLAALGLRRPRWRWLGATVPFTALSFVVGSITGLLSQSLFPQVPANQCVSLRSAYGGAIWLAVIGVAVIAPFVEEVIFRGMVFGWLRGRVAITWAVLISAAVFSLEHIGFLEVTLFLPIFAAGVVLAILYHHARSIWPNVVVHGAFNFIATLVLLGAPSC